MKWIPFVDMLDYLETTSVSYPITLELVLPMDSPVQLEFNSIDEVNEWACDTAGFINSSGMRETLSRVV
jgi:hypothetical protein|tara:strand:- start:345 stop:551 length:207 start_codon:yes stop_codon:yes gene_type:complete